MAIESKDFKDPSDIKQGIGDLDHRLRGMIVITKRAPVKSDPGVIWCKYDSGNTSSIAVFIRQPEANVWVQVI